MAIRLEDTYPNRVGPANSDYPHGFIKNESAPDAGDGTPLERQWGNDLVGFMQALLETAGITPDGTPDTAPSSQHMDALLDVTRGLTEVDVAGATNVTLATYDRRMAMVRLTGTLTGDIDVIVPDTARHYVFINATSGSFTVTVKTAAGTGVRVLKNDPHWLYSDGANVKTLLYSKKQIDNGAGVSVGSYVTVQDDLVGAEAPDNDAGDAKFIKLTAGEDGAGQYNEGLLTSESVSGSAPLVVATAVIDDSDSPMDGQTVHLLNTENRYLMPGESPGTVANDQMQQITGSTGDGSTADIIGQSAAQDGVGAILFSNAQTGGEYVGGGNGSSYRIGFDSANSPNARTGNHTNVKRIETTYYMRIR